jgi:class 3 adenylate cyclase
MNFEHTKFLQGEYGFMQLESINERTPERCEDFPLKIKIPATVSQYPEYKRFTSFAYCIPFQVKLTENVDWGIFLGFIDNKHRIFLNGTLISSTELKEKRNYSLFYESPILLPIYEHGLKEDNVLIVKASKFNPYAEDGGGIYAGILKLDDFERILTQNQISKAYGLSKNVLFLSTSLLFFILFLSRTANREYLWFAVFLVGITIYEFCRLELKQDLGINLVILKYIEYLMLCFLLPIFSFFLFAILYKGKYHFVPLTILAGGVVFFGLFIFAKDIYHVEIINTKYHVPYLLFSCILLFIFTTRELFKKNQRALPVFISSFIPFLLTFFDLLNKKYQILPAFANIQVSGDSILVLVTTMTFYVSYGYYSLQKKLDNTMHKEETLRKTFQLYVPPRDIEKILSNFNANEELLNLGELEEKIILFCDIRNFTDLSEKLNPNQTVNFLNSYFKTFNRIIIENGGVIDKLIGDCIMARFDAGKEFDAINCALDMISALVPYNRARRKLATGEVSHGIGLASGKVIVGNIGSINKMDYTVIGDTVNIASRLESLTKFYQVSILVTERIQLKLQDKILFREIDTIQIKGKRKITKIFEPLGIRN